MTKEELRRILCENPWFERLSDKHMDLFVSISRLESWPGGTMIFREGGKDHDLYLILEGRVALDITVPTRGRVTILTLSRNEIFGWSAVLPVEMIRTSSARTILDTKAIVIDANALREACESDFELGYIVYRRLNNIIAGRLMATRLQLLDMYAHGGEVNQ
jgi:CRP-like cAMP-binding protein